MATSPVTKSIPSLRYLSYRLTMKPQGNRWLITQMVADHEAGPDAAPVAGRAMAVESPVSQRATVTALLLLTFATGLVDAVSVLVLGHVFVANMTGNVIFLGFWFVPHSGVDMTAAVVAFASFVAGTVLGGRFARHLDTEVRRWLGVALGAEVVMLGALRSSRAPVCWPTTTAASLILIAGLAVVFGTQNATARQFGVQELSTTVLTQTIVGIGFDSRLAGGTGQREKLRYGVILTMCSGAVVGATLTLWTVAPVIAIAAAVVATSASIFAFGPAGDAT